MHSIKHNVQIDATPEVVFRAISEPKYLDQWWTVRSAGKCGLLEYYQFYFSDDYDWSAQITELSEFKHLRYLITEADEDWTGTSLDFKIQEISGSSLLSFEHVDWSTDNAHFRRSSYCWALYLKGLKHLLEKGESISYEHRTE